MREWAHTILAVLALVLGLIHCGLALSAPSLTIDLLWFVGAGAAMICVALSNLLRGRPTSGACLGLAIQNAMMTGFFAAAWLVFPAPQVIVGGALFSAMLLLGALAFARRGDGAPA